MTAKRSQVRHGGRGKKQKDVEEEQPNEPVEMDDSSSSEGSSSESSSNESSSDGEEEPAPQKNKSSKAFSDENASWLQLKQGKKAPSNLLEEDSDQPEQDDEEELEIEREARLLDQQDEEEREEAEADYEETVRLHTEVYHLPTLKELEQDQDRVVPPSELKANIESILQVLSDFKARREPGRSRSEYVAQLGAYIAELYGYLPELVDYFLTMFGPTEALEFVAASDRPRPMVIRTNTLKTRRKDLAAALMKRGVTLDPLASWSKVGLLIVDSTVPMGATPEYLSGQYMLQSAASLCPVLALSPQPQERVLDMASAPGGKTSYVAQLMRNTGYIVANDLRPERQKATVANLHRLGVTNTVTCCHDGRKLGTLYKNRFDRVLLDAPCSGLGIISRDPSVKVQRTMADVKQCAHLQKELILSAIDALKCKDGGGILVYSTCSVSVAENEAVVNYALSKRNVRLVDTELEFGTPGYTRFQQERFPPSMALCRRFFPHVQNMDGFFVAKLQKLGDSTKSSKDESKVEETAPQDMEVSTQQTDDKDASRQPSKKKGKGKGGKKRKTPNEEDTASVKKRSGVSVPPKKPKQKKSNAKMTKPRRIKASEAT